MIALYAGNLVSQTCAPMLNARNTVDSPKKMNADFSSGSDSAKASAEAAVWTDANALSTSTPLTATAIIACPDIMD